MILLVHLTVAFGSMAYATYLFFAPSRRGMRTAAILVALTFASGFWLVLAHPVPMANVCVTGVVYIGYVAYALVSSRNKLVKVSGANLV